VGFALCERRDRLQRRTFHQSSVAKRASLAGPVVLRGLADILITGLKRAFGQPQVYRGKILSVVLTIVSLFPIGLTAFVSVVTRRLPDAAATPHVGQRVPDFTLVDTNGRQVSLDQLLAAQPGSQAAAAKAVLLIFYRGYW